MRLILTGLYVRERRPFRFFCINRHNVHSVFLTFRKCGGFFRRHFFITASCRGAIAIASSFFWTVRFICSFSSLLASVLIAGMGMLYFDRKDIQ
nr:MAG TPA: hypothetical protein [Caudoviricetes sp.]